ncbi:hypothetical protein ES708_03043 [subsurface metagenome]
MNDIKFPLIDLRGLSKPATKLIDAVSGAIGAIYEPTRIRRKAKAEADIALILAQNRSDVRDIELRADARLRTIELRRQENVEAITGVALQSLPDHVSDEPVDEDWIYDFYNNCQDVSNKEMQRLWGRILAGEIAQPGTYSLKTLVTVRTIRKEEAEYFNTLGTFTWTDDGGEYYCFIYDHDHQVIRHTNFLFISLLQLQSLGLIYYQDFGYKINNIDKQCNIYYHGLFHTIIPPQGSKKNLDLGIIMLTNVGQELMPLVDAEPLEEYRIHIVEQWKSAGWIVEVANGNGE